MSATDNKKESFIFYRSFYEAISDLEVFEQLDVYQAICEYSFNGTQPTLSGISATIFKLIKPQLQANHKRYENGIKGGKYGKLGGRPKKEKPQNNPTGDISDNPEETPNKNVNDNVNVNLNENKNKNENVNDEKPVLFKVWFESLEETKGMEIKNFMPTVFDNEWKERHGEVNEKAWNEYDKFLNYFADPKNEYKPSANCKKPSKLDWVGTWRNWIIK